MTSPNNPYYLLPLVDDTIKIKRKLFIPRTPSNSPPPNIRKRTIDNIYTIIDLFNNIDISKSKKITNMNIYNFPIKEK